MTISQQHADRRKIFYYSFPIITDNVFEQQTDQLGTIELSIERVYTRLETIMHDLHTVQQQQERHRRDDAQDQATITDVISQLNQFQHNQGMSFSVTDRPPTPFSPPTHFLYSPIPTADEGNASDHSNHNCLTPEPYPTTPSPLPLSPQPLSFRYSPIPSVP